MKNNGERILGEQPLAGIMETEGILSADLVADKETQLSFKMIARAMKGRRLTLHAQSKILRVINSITHKKYELHDLFNY